MANIGQLDSVFRLIFKGLDVAVFPKALQDDLLKVLRNADNVDNMADDIAAWRRGILDDGATYIDEAGEAVELTDDMRRFFADPIQITRFNALEHVHKAATEFDTAYKSAADTIDVDGLIAKIDKDTGLAQADLAQIREAFQKSIQTRETTINNLIRDYPQLIDEAKAAGAATEEEAQQMARARALEALEAKWKQGEGVAPTIGDDVVENADQTDEVVENADKSDDAADAGNDVDPDNPFLDAQGRQIDDQGRLIDDQSRLIDEEGRLIDEEGRLVDEEGRLIDDAEEAVDPPPSGALDDADVRPTPGADETVRPDRNIFRSAWDATLGYYVKWAKDYVTSFPYFERVGGFDLHRWQRHFSQPFHNQWNAFRDDNAVSFVLNLDSSLKKSSNYVSTGRMSAADALVNLRTALDPATSADDLAKAVQEARKAADALSNNLAAIERTGSIVAKRAAGEAGEFITDYTRHVAELEAKIADGATITAEEMTTLRNATNDLHKTLAGNGDTDGLAKQILQRNVVASTTDAPHRSFILRQDDWNAIRDFDVGLVEMPVTRQNGFSRSEVRAAQRAERSILLQGAPDGKHIQQRNIEAAWALTGGVDPVLRRQEIRTIIQKGVFEMLADGKKDELITSLKRLMFTYGDDAGEIRGAAPNIQHRGQGIPNDMLKTLREALDGTETAKQVDEIEEMGRLIEHMYSQQNQVPVRRRAALVEEFNMNYYREFRLDRRSDASVITDARDDLKAAKREFREAEATRTENPARFDRARLDLNAKKEALKVAKKAGFLNYHLNHRFWKGSVVRSFAMMAKYPKMIGVPRTTMKAMKWVILPAALVKGGEMAYDFLTGNTPEASTIEEAKEYSQEFVEQAEENVENVNAMFEDLEAELAKNEEETLKELDELIAGESDPTKKAQYEAVRAQVTETIAGFRTELGRNKAVFLQASQDTLNKVKELDTQMQSVDTLEKARELNALQQAHINAIAASMLEFDEKRKDEMDLGFDNLDEAIKNRAVLGTAPTMAPLDQIITMDTTIDPANADIGAIKLAAAENINIVNGLPAHINARHGSLEQAIDVFLRQQTTVLDEKIRTLTEAGKAEEAAKCEEVKAQMLQTMTGFRNTIGGDKTRLLEAAENAKTQAAQLNAQIQASNDPAQAGQLLATQNQTINAVSADVTNTIGQRAEEIRRAGRQIIEAIENSRPLTVIPAPEEVIIPDPNRDPNRDRDTDQQPPVVTTPKDPWEITLDQQRAEARQLLRESRIAIGHVGLYVTNPNGDALGAAQIIESINAQDKAIVELQDELRRKGEDGKADALQYILDQVRLGEADAQQNQVRLGETQTEIKALGERATDLERQIKEITEIADKNERFNRIGDATNLLRDLKATRDQIEGKREEAQQLLTNISNSARDNAELMNKSQDIRYRYGNAYQIDEGLRKIGGGEYGLPSQLFGRGEAGVGSVVGGWLQTAWGSVRGVGDWWGDMKRNARTQNERNWLNAIETGAGIFGSLVVFNFLNDKVFGGKIQGMAKWGIMLAVAGYFLHRSGAVGSAMADQARGRRRSTFVAQSNGGVNSRTTSRSHIPVVRSTTTNNGTGNVPDTSGTVTAPIVDRNGNKVDELIFMNGTLSTVDSSGNLVSNIVLDPKYAEQFHAKLQAELERIKTAEGITPAMAGQGTHLPNPLKGAVEISITDSTGAPLQTVEVDYSIDNPETADLTKPK